MTLRDYIVRAVEEKGADYVYPDSERDTTFAWNGLGGQCQYFTDSGKPSCIFGHVLSYLGYTRAIEGASAEQVLDGKGFTDQERSAAFYAQLVQDGTDAANRPSTWGDVLAAYDRALGALPGA